MGRFRASNRYLLDAVKGADTKEVAAFLGKAQESKRANALRELLNSGPLSPEFSEAIHGGSASQETEGKDKGLLRD
jgi:hypothetical protein